MKGSLFEIMDKENVNEFKNETQKNEQTNLLLKKLKNVGSKLKMSKQII